LFFQSTYYGKYQPGVGACELDPISPVNSQQDWIMVAAGQYDYQKSVGCGMCIEVKGDGTPSTPNGGNDIPIKGPYKATVIDLCGDCNQGDTFNLPIFQSCAIHFKNDTFPK
jgi:hypothetical protein